MPVPPYGCDDSDIFDCGARHHAERFSIGDITTTMLLLPNVACGTHASASRWLRRRWHLRLWGSASRRAVFDRGQHHNQIGIFQSNPLHRALIQNRPETGKNVDFSKKKEKKQGFFTKKKSACSM
jgi:hypothetical protein